MSIKAMTWAFEQPLSGNEKVVLLAIADHANDVGECWPSVATIAKKACVSERTVQRVMLLLSDQGYVSRVSRSGDKDGRALVNRYVLHMGEHQETAEYASEQYEGVNLTGGGCHGCHPPGDTVVTPYEPSIRTINNINTKRERGTPVPMPDDFVLNETNVRLCRERDISDAEAFDQIERMRNWSVNAGKKGLKVDWQRAANNWLRDYADKRKVIPRNGSHRSDNTVKNAFRDLWGAVEAEEARAAQEGLGGGGDNSLAIPRIRQDAA